MPYLPPPKQRPWLPKKEEKQHQGRTERSKLYNTAQWRRVRAAQLRDYPLCVQCEKDGRVTAANVADHIQRYNTVKGKIDFFDRSNLQSLCDSCHARKSASERHG